MSDNPHLSIVTVLRVGQDLRHKLCQRERPAAELAGARGGAEGGASDPFSLRQAVISHTTALNIH